MNNLDPRKLFYYGMVLLRQHKAVNIKTNQTYGKDQRVDC